MEEYEVPENRNTADAGWSERASGAAWRRNRVLLPVGVGLGLGLLACLFAYLGHRSWPSGTAPPLAAGGSEQNRPADVSGSTVRPSASAPQAQILALRQEAFDVVARIARDLPDAPDALCARGLIYKRYGKRAQAVGCWERCLELDLDFAGAYYGLGWEALDRAEYAQSAKRLRKALEIDPEMGDAHLLLARALMALGQVEEATAVLEDHVRVWPRSAEGYFRLGQAYLQAARYRKAKQCHQVALEIDPAYARAYYGLAMACQRLGETDQSEKYHETFAKLKANEPGLAMGRARPHDDPASLRRSLADVYVTAANLYLAHGRLDRAEEYWRKAAALDPTETDARKALFSVYQQHNRPDDALGVLDELSQLEPENLVHYINIGTLNMRLKRFEPAEEAFQKVQALSPERPEGYVALAELYVRAGRKLPEATALAQKAVELAPIPANYFLLSLACERNGDYPEALKAIQQAIDQDPENPGYQEAYDRIRKQR